MPSLKDKTVLVIGRGSGIARAIAVAISEDGGRVISPGTIDTGAYDALGDERKAALFQARSAANPARRIGTADDIAASYYDIADAHRAAWSYQDAWTEVQRISGLISFEPDKVEVHLDGTRLCLEPGQTVIPHGPDRDLTADEVVPARQP